MMIWFVTKTLLVIFALVLLPGWAILAVSGYWRKWDALQRWFLAACLGVAFWPILYYSTRIVFPSLRIGVNKLIILLLFFAVLIVVNMRKSWREQFLFDKKPGLYLPFYS